MIHKKVSAYKNIKKYNKYWTIFGYLLIGYKASAYYWEFIILTLRFILTFISVTYRENLELRNMINLTFLIIYCLLVLEVKPYK